MYLYLKIKVKEIEFYEYFSLICWFLWNISYICNIYWLNKIEEEVVAQRSPKGVGCNDHTQCCEPNRINCCFGMYGGRLHKLAATFKILITLGIVYMRYYKSSDYMYSIIIPVYVLKELYQLSLTLRLLTSYVNIMYISPDLE